MPRDFVGAFREPMLLIANAHAGRGRARKRAEQLAAALRRAGLPFSLACTQRPGHARELAAAAAGSTVVVIGGDGTVHEVVNGLVPCSGVLGPIAVLPSGSGDDFAASAGLTHDPAELAERLLAPALRLVDVGSAEIEVAGGTRTLRFVNNLGVGFEAEVARQAARTHWLRGSLLYVAATLRALWRQRSAPCELAYTRDGGVVTEAVSTLFVSCCNGRRVGGGLAFAPDARLDDGELDVLRVTSSSRCRTLALLLRLLRRTHLDDPRVRLERCRAVDLRLGAPTPVCMDGETVADGAARVRAGIAAERLRLAGC